MAIQLGNLRLVFRKVNKGETANNPGLAFDRPGTPKGFANILKSTAFTPGKSNTPMDPAVRAFAGCSAIGARMATSIKPR